MGGSLGSRYGRPEQLIADEVRPGNGNVGGVSADRCASRQSPILRLPALLDLHVPLNTCTVLNFMIPSH
jgi:hypothetical protein